MTQTVQVAHLVDKHAMWGDDRVDDLPPPRQVPRAAAPAQGGPAAGLAAARVSSSSVPRHLADAAVQALPRRVGAAGRPQGEDRARTRPVQSLVLLLEEPMASTDHEAEHAVYQDASMFTRQAAGYRISAPDAGSADP